MTYRLNNSPNAYGCHDPQCLDSTWDHECPVAPAAGPHGLAAMIDLTVRALAASNEPPILFASDNIVDQWVLVPRKHLRTMLDWHGEIDETNAIMMCTAILADARPLGQLSQHPEYVAYDYETEGLGGT